ASDLFKQHVRHVEPVEMRQHQIEHHQVGAERARELERLAPVIRHAHRVPRPFEVQPHQLDGLAIVVDDQQVYGLAPGVNWNCTVVLPSALTVGTACIRWSISSSMCDLILSAVSFGMTPSLTALSISERRCAFIASATRLGSTLCARATSASDF